MLIDAIRAFDISESIAYSICNSNIIADVSEFSIIKNESKLIASVKDVDESFDLELLEKVLSFSKKQHMQKV